MGANDAGDAGDAEDVEDTGDEEDAEDVEDAEGVEGVERLGGGRQEQTSKMRSSKNRHRAGPRANGRTARAGSGRFSDSLPVALQKRLLHLLEQPCCTSCKTHLAHPSTCAPFVTFCFLLRDKDRSL